MRHFLHAFLTGVVTERLAQYEAMELLSSQAQGRPDKNDVLLQELLEVGNFKQALANVDKRLRKSRNDKLLVRVLPRGPGAFAHRDIRSTEPSSLLPCPTGTNEHKESKN